MIGDIVQLLMFVSGAIFSALDIGSDYSVAVELYQNPEIDVSKLANDISTTRYSYNPRNH